MLENIHYNKLHANFDLSQLVAFFAIVLVIITIVSGFFIFLSGDDAEVQDEEEYYTLTVETVSSFTGEQIEAEVVIFDFEDDVDIEDLDYPDVVYNSSDSKEVSADVDSGEYLITASSVDVLSTKEITVDSDKEVIIEV